MVGVALKVFIFIIFEGLCHPTSVPIINVMTVVQEPFIMPGSGSDSRWGYKGILIDLAKVIIKNADLKITSLGGYDFGKKYENGTWSGLIGEMANNKSTTAFVLAPMTINSERLDAVQFSSPFFTSGLSVVGKGIDFPINRENLPKILKMAEDGNITVGVVKGIADEAFFKNTDTEVYKKLYKQMKKSDSNFAKTYDEGLAKVRNAPKDKPYVFFGEKDPISYYVEKAPCDLHMPPCETLMTVHYALVFKKSTPYETVNSYNKAISDYLASGKMDVSKQKWYKNECHFNETVV